MPCKNCDDLQELLVGCTTLPQLKSYLSYVLDRLCGTRCSGELVTVGLDPIVSPAAATAEAFPRLADCGECALLVLRDAYNRWFLSIDRGLSWMGVLKHVVTVGEVESILVDESNRDTDVPLEGGELTGGSVTPDNTGSNALSLGDSGGSDFRLAQSFQIASGQLSEIQLPLQANVGSPTGNVTWRVHEDAAGIPGTVLASGTFTPTPSSNNIIPVADGPILEAGTTYWVSFQVPIQATNNRYTAYRNPSGVYADGQLKWDSTSTGTFPNTWTGGGGTEEMRVTVTTSAVLSNEKLAQTFTLTEGGTIASIDLWLKKVGTPAGTVTVRIETTSAGQPTGTLADPEATATFSEASLGTGYAYKTVIFAGEVTLSPGQFAIVLSTDRASSASDYIDWGADSSSPGFAGGEMWAYDGAAWSAPGMDAIFALSAPVSSIPTASDDASAGYHVGSRWINMTLGDEWVCVDASVGAALWAPTTGGSVTGTLVLIDSGELSSAAASIDITGIPADYQDLILVLRIRIDFTSATPLAIRFNGDSGANYAVNFAVVSHIGSQTHTNQHNQNQIAPVYSAAHDGTDTAGHFSHVYMEILSYADASISRGGWWTSSRFVDAATLARGQGAFGWENLANAINQITLFPLTGGNFVAGTTWHLYGRGVPA